MKTIKLSRQAVNILGQMKQAFIDKFGREPGANDPIFFDPDADEPRFFSDALITEMEEVLCSAMHKAGFDPAVIYAYKKTGLLVTEESKRHLSRAEMKEWREAINEYHVKYDQSD
jgi:hypothetical protein